MPSSFSVFIFFFCTAAFAGFGMYSLFYFYQKRRNPTRYLKRWDADACTILLTSGMVYLALYLSELILFFIQVKDELRPGFLTAFYGPDGYWFWAPPVFYFVLTQLFWFPRLREMAVLRVIIGLVLFIGFSNLLKLGGMSIPSYPVTWELMPEYAASGYIFVDYIIKILVFIALVAAVYFMRNRKKSK